VPLLAASSSFKVFKALIYHFDSQSEDQFPKEEMEFLKEEME